jgi:hypothetical protein
LRDRGGGPGSSGLTAGVTSMAPLMVRSALASALALMGGLESKRLLDKDAGAGAGAGAEGAA